MTRSLEKPASKTPVVRIGRKRTPARRNGRIDDNAATGVFTLLPTVSKPELLDADGASDRGFRQFLYDFSSLASYLASARSYLAAQLGVSSPQYNILMIIAQYQGYEGVSVSDVAQHLHVTTAFITGEARKLERAGLLEKRPNPSDGRGILLRLTAQGEDSVQRIAPERLFVNDHLFQSMSGEDFRHLANTVASLLGDFSRTVDMLESMQRSQTVRMAGRK